MRFNYKKLVAAGAATLSIAAVLTACSGKKSNTSVNKDTKHGIALVTDGNGVDDHSFNQAAWSGFKDYGKEHGLKQGKGGYQYFNHHLLLTSPLTLLKLPKPAIKPSTVSATC